MQKETVGLTNATAVRDMCAIMLQADAVLNNLHAICMVSFVPSCHLQLYVWCAHERVAGGYYKEEICHFLSFTFNLLW